MFHCVLAVRHHKAKLEVKALKQTLTEVMPLDHTELIHWLLANSKLYTVQTSSHQSVHTEPANMPLMISTSQYHINNHRNAPGKKYVNETKAA